MTNASLLDRRDQDGYTVYGVGADQRDDNGDLGALPPYSVGWWISPEDAPDWGLRVWLPDEAPALTARVRPPSAPGPWRAR